MEARFRVSLGNGTFEVSGSQEFVEGQIEKHSEVLLDMVDKLRHGHTEANNSGGNTGTDADPPSDQGSENNGSDIRDSFENVLAFDDGEVTVIADIPGKNSKTKTVNAALLYLFGKDSLGEAKASFKEIRQVCTEHGFLDSPNFAQYLKSEKSRFIVSGKGQSQEVKLTVPGKKAARDLAEELENK